MRTAESAPLNDTLDLNTLQAVLAEHPVRLAILFGSHATDSTHATSDLDLAVEFDDKRPADPDYNDVFLGLSADLSETFETNDVDLVDLHAASPQLAAAIFENGILLLGEQARATELRQQLTTDESPQQSSRDRLDGALERIDAHLDEPGSGVPVAGDSEDDIDSIGALYD